MPIAHAMQIVRNPEIALTVVVACLNGASTLSAQLDALLGQETNAEWEVVVADNGSTDGSREIVVSYGVRDDRVRLVDASDRSGLAHARNVGARAARGAALAFCDQDDVVASGWLQAMLDGLAQHDVVAGSLDYDLLNDPWTISVRGRPQSHGLLEYPELDYLPFAFGCTLGVRRRVHESIGGFDEEFTSGCEDADYCWRLQRAGHQLVFVPEAKTHYRLRHDLRSIFRQARAYGSSEAKLYRKHLAAGLPPLRRPLLRAFRMWLGAFRSLVRVRSRSDLAVAAWRVGLRFGRLRGSLMHHVLFP